MVFESAHISERRAAPHNYNCYCRTNFQRIKVLCNVLYSKVYGMNTLGYKSNGEDTLFHGM